MKIKRILCVLLVIVLILPWIPARPVSAADWQDPFASGAGTAEDPYLITNANQLVRFWEVCSDTMNYSGRFIKLNNDIDMTGVQKWDRGIQGFRGTFDGDGHKIIGLNIENTGSYGVRVGLFETLYGNVKNLGVTGTVAGYNAVGGIAGVSNGSIENCYNSARISAKNYGAGGIVGSNTGPIRNCYNTGTISAATEAGGIIGCYVAPSSEIRIENCYNVGNVSVEKEDASAGGIVGRLESGNVINCYFLKGTAEKGLGIGYSRFAITEKTQEEFASGDVANLLQGTGDLAEGQTWLWGQDVTSDAKDSLPILTDNIYDRVLKLTFMSRSEGIVFKTSYVNYMGQISKDKFPPDVQERVDYEFERWVTDQDGTVVTFDTTARVAEDTIIYAWGVQKISATDRDGNIALEQETEISPIDLRDYVRNKTSDPNKYFAFTLVSGSSLPAGLSLANGIITGTPTEMGKSTVEISVKSESEIYMSTYANGTPAYDETTRKITLNFNVGLQGGGTAENPYKIINLASLIYLRDQVKVGNSYAGKYIQLAGDLDIGSWEPIGTVTAPFQGDFDGNGHKITYQITGDTDNVGLFGYLKEGRVHCLGVSSSVSGMTNVGGIVGYSDKGVIVNCYNDGTVRGDSTAGSGAGGIVGYMAGGKIESCYVSGSVSGKDNVGGIVGTYNDGTVSSCYYQNDKAPGSIGSSYTPDAADIHDVEGKSEEDFKSGKVANLLQKNQTVQVWGQKLSSTADAYPVLTEDSAKRVHKVTFLVNDKPESAYTEYAVKYVNRGTVNLPDIGRKGVDGWAKQKNGTPEPGMTYLVESDITLYAHWKEYTVKYNTKSGTTIADKTTLKWTDKVLEGIADPVRDGYCFRGWKYGDVDVTAETTYADLAEEDTVATITLTAQWTDYAAPVGEIRIDGRQWATFLNGITFGIFYRECKTVTIIASDNSDEVVAIAYLLSDQEYTRTELLAQTFTAYTAPFTLHTDKEYVIYARLTDSSGNVTYINTDGIVLDTISPDISGIVDGGIYCQARTVTVTDKYIESVTVNNEKVTLDSHNQFVLSPAQGTQSVVVTDKAGNRTVVTVTINAGHTPDADDNGTATVRCKVCGAILKENTANKSPLTGDPNAIGLWLAWLLLSSGILTGMIVAGRKKH